MTGKSIFASLLCAACAIFLASCAATFHQVKSGAKQWTQVVESLEREATPDALVTAALIRGAQLRDASGAIVSLERALVLDPRQPDAAWLALALCVQTADCQIAPRASTLAALDPGNAVADYPALAAAHAKGDITAEDRALAAMAEGKTFDIYWSRLITRATDTLARPRGRTHRPLRELRQAATEVVGWLAAVGIPAFTSVSGTCKGERLQRDDVIAWCRKLAGVLDNGDTYIAAMMGRAIGYRVWPPESSEYAVFRERLREYRYVTETVKPFADKAEKSIVDTQRVLDRLRTNRSERDAFRQWLTDLHIPPDPPAGWVSKEEPQK